MLVKLMKWWPKKITVVTHNGSFHADEVFACATLLIWAEKMGYRLRIKRTRDPEVVKMADIAVDVGMEYVPDRGRFDHHQKGGAGQHSDGIPYASFGLVWQHYGRYICSEDLSVYERVKKSLVMPIDARDNGVTLNLANRLGIQDYRISKAISIFNLTWQEELSKTDEQFEKVLGLAKEIITREISVTRAEVEGKRLVKEEILKQNSPAILILDKYVDWEEAVSEDKNIKFVVFRHRNGRDWAVQTGCDNLEDYGTNRASMPASWGGLRESELQKVSGIDDAAFCTNGGWFGTAHTKLAALKMAEIALQDSSN